MKLSEKYRPRTFDRVLGQPSAVEWCISQLQLPLPGSVLLHGPTGTGKTTLGKIYAAALLCEAPKSSARPCLTCEPCRDFRRGNPHNYISYNCARMELTDVSALLEATRANAFGADFRVILLDEAHRLPPKGFDMLLTVLDNPQINVFVFATTDLAKIPQTIENRCATIEVSLVDDVTAVRHLIDICAIEKIEAEPEALNLISFQAAGHVRALVQCLEDVVKNRSVTADAVRRHFHLDSCDRLTEFLKATIEGKTAQALQLLDEWGERPERKRQLIHECLVELYRRDVLGYCP